MIRRWILLVFMLVIGGGIAAAHEEGVVRQNYYAAADANGVQQVYQVRLDDLDHARQITHAASDVLTFGVAHDGLGIAYISGGQLWLQSVHTEEAEALAPISATRFFRSPVYSPDDQYIAYPNNGVWLLDLPTRQTRQVLADVPLEPQGANSNEFRLYLPEQFVVGADGKASKLIVDVGIWEWNTVGVYDLASGDFQILEGQIHTALLPLQDGRVLLYGNNAISGEPALHVADSLDDIDTYTNVMNFGSLTNIGLFAEQAVEVHEGVVRIFGQGIPAFPDEVKVFYFDYDLTTNIVGQMHVVTLRNEDGTSVYFGNLSPDGSQVPVYHNGLYSDWGTPYGTLDILNIVSAETSPIAGTTGLFRWQP